MPLDSYQLFLDEKSLGSNPRRLIGQVTFDGVIKAVIHSKDSGAKTVGSMSFNAGGTYASSLQGGRAFEKKGVQDIQTTLNYKDNHDWFRLSSDKKTIYVGADNGKPGDFMRVIVAATPDNTAPVAGDATLSVTENTYSKYENGNSYHNIINNSSDTDGDQIKVTNIQYDIFTNDGDTLLSLIHI